MAPTDPGNAIAIGTPVRRESSDPMRPAAQPASRPRNANGATKKMPVPMRFVDDTPLIMMSNATIPGMGTFNVRVFFYGDEYAGTWYHSMARFAANALVRDRRFR